MSDDVKTSLVLLVLVLLAFSAGLVVGGYVPCPPLCPADEDEPL